MASTNATLYAQRLDRLLRLAVDPDVPTIDWNRLSPHRPLGVADAALHVQRPGTDGGERLAAKVRGGLGPIAVAGPVGCGKSTELAVAARALQKEAVACLVQVDQILDLQSLQSAPDELLNSHLFSGLAGRVAHLAVNVLHLDLSEELRTTFAAHGVLGKEYASAQPAYQGTSDDLLRVTIREVARKSAQGRVVLLIDGLEKGPETVLRPIVESIIAFQDDVGIVLVVPPSLVTGPESQQIFAGGVRVFPIRAIPVADLGLAAQWQEGRQFLLHVAGRRLKMPQDVSVPADFESQIDAAAGWSGGVPRVFLQIVRDAGMYGSLAKREFPNKEDFFDALLDQHESLARILRDGDMALLNGAKGSDGREVPIDRRLRFLTHGLLLEYAVGNQIVVSPAPLIARPTPGIVP